MRLILKQNVPHVGRTGDLVSVKEGFARNFLLPRGIAAIANEKNVTELEHNKKMLEKKRLKERASHQELADRLKDFSVTLKRKVGEGDKLFGSVTSHDVSEALVAAGHDIQKSQVLLPHAIKTLGVHNVSVKFEQDITAEIKVWVAKEEA